MKTGKLTRAQPLFGCKGNTGRPATVLCNHSPPGARHPFQRRSRSLRITAEDIWEILDAGTTPLVDTLEDSVADAIERFAVSFNSKSPLVLASEVSETPTMPINGSSRQAAPEPYEPVVAKSASQAKGAAVKTPEKSNTPTSDDAGTSEKAERLPASSSLSSSVPSPPDTDAAAANATLVPAAPTTGQSHDAAAAPVPQEASPASGIGSTLEEEAESEVSDVSDVSSVHTSDLSGLDSAAEGDGATGMSEKAPAQRVKKPRRKAAKAAKPRLTLSLSTVEPKAVAEEPPVVAAKPRRRSRATKRKSGNEPTQKEPQPPIATAKRTRRSSRRSAGTEEAQETNWSLKIEPKMELLCRDSQEW